MLLERLVYGVFPLETPPKSSSGGDGLGPVPKAWREGGESMTSDGDVGRWQKEPEPPWKKRF